MTDVNREVRLTITTEGEEEARKQIEGVIKGLSGKINISGTSGTSSSRARGMDAISQLDKNVKASVKIYEDNLKKEMKEKAREFEAQLKFQKMRRAQQDAENDVLLKAQREIKKKEELKQKEILKNINVNQMSGFSDEIMDAAESFRNQFKEEAEKLSDSFDAVDTSQMGEIFEDMISAADSMRKTYEKQKITAENTDNSMRKSLTGMLIWMHTFRVFGEYSAVLKNQFTMLGNALGMILNQILIPLYPLLIGVTLVFYQIAAALRVFFKAIGNIPSLILSLAFSIIVLYKLFIGGWIGMKLHNKAVDADTLALAKHTAMLGGSTAGGAAGGTAAGGIAGGILAKLSAGIGSLFTKVFGRIGTKVAAESALGTYAPLGARALSAQAMFFDPKQLQGKERSSFEALKKQLEPQGKIAEKHLAEAKIANKFTKEQTQPWYMTIKSYLAGIFALLSAPFNAIVNAAKNTLGAAIDIAKAIWDWLVKSLGNTWDAAVKIGGLILDWIKGGFKDPLGLVTSIISVFIEWIKTEFKLTYNLAGKIAEIITKWVETTLPGGKVVAEGMRGAAGFIDQKKNETITTVTNTENTVAQAPIIIQNTFNGIINPEELARMVKNSLNQVNTGGSSLSW